MKKLDLSQYIHNSFWETKRPHESQFVNHFCCKSRTNSQKWAAWHWHFQNRNLRGFSLILTLNRLRDWQGMMKERRIKQPGSWTETLLLFWPVCNLLFIFQLHKTRKKLGALLSQLQRRPEQILLVTSWGFCSKSCEVSRGIEKKAFTFSQHLLCGVGQWNYIFKPWKCGKLQLWILW